MSIDDKIVAVSLDVGKFEEGVKKVVSGSDKLKSSLQFPDAGKGLENIDKAAQRINLSHIASSVDSIAGKLSALRLTAIAVFASIASRAISAGANIVKSFSLQPIIQGFNEYSTNLNAVQTILANTQASGATLKDVNAALLNLNKYSDKTIYNFSQMAKNIGTFTAAGVDLKTSQLKVIANLAALSGSNAEQASTAMYQLSQAISAGRVSLQDWNSVVNAGMGGTVFQRALAQTAVAMGKIRESSLKLVGPMKNVSINGETFRQSIQTGPGRQSWLTSDVLTKTLSQFTGDLSKAQLQAQGFNEQQIKSIQQTAKTAQNAATEVKTLSQVFEVAKETIGSGWAQTFQIIFGDFGEAKKTFTALSNAINNFVNRNAKARNAVLKDWKALGGRTVLIDNIKLAFQNVSEILKPIRRAFRDIFPKTTGRDLYNLTLAFQRFAEALKPSPTTMENLRRTFRGLFAILDIGKQLISGVVTVFKTLFNQIGVGGGGFLHLTANIGDFLVSVDEALKKGNALHKFFVGLGHALAVPIKVIQRVKDAIVDLFSGFSPGGISGSANKLSNALNPLQKVLAAITLAWNKFKEAFSNAAEFFQPQIDQILEGFQNLGPAIAEAIKHMNVEAILQVIRTGLLAGIFLLFKNFLGKGGLLRLTQRNSITIFSLIFKNVGKGLDALTGSLEAMQTSLKAKAIRDIAIAVALLAASVVALSFVDPKKLNAALTALTIMFVELIGAMKILANTTTGKSVAKLTVLSVALIGLAAAIDLLTIAVFALSRLSWEELAKGLGGVAALLGTIAAISGPLGKGAPGMIRAGLGITAIAVGLNILALAVRQLGGLKLSELAKGLGAIAVSLGVIAIAMKAMPTATIIKGAGLIAVAAALNIIAVAVGQFADMDLKTIGRGILGIAGALVVIAGAMQLMPISLPITAAGLLLVSLSLGKIGKAVASMGKLSLKQIAKGLGTLAGALLILAGALAAMSGSVGGAIALGITAAGISLLTPALVTLGKQSWTQIVKGLVSLAAAFALLGAAGLLLAPITPALLGLGTALVLVGGGLALAGAGVALIGVGLSAIAVAGPTAVAILIQSFKDLTAAIPDMVKNLVLGLLEIVRAFAKTAPEFVDAMIKILDSLLEVVIKSTPKLVEVFETLIDAAIKVIRDKNQDIIKAGFELLLNFLKGIRDNIKELIVTAADIVINLLKGIASQAVRIIAAGFDIIVKIIEGITKGLLSLVDAGARAIVKFLNGVAKAIRKYEPQILAAGAKIGIAIVQGMIDGLGSMVGKLKDKIFGIVKAVPNIFKKHWIIKSPSKLFYVFGVNVIEGLTNGLSDNQEAPVKVARQMAENVKRAMETSLGITGGGSSKTIQNLGRLTAQSFAKGIRGSSDDIKDAFTELNNKLLDAMRDSREKIKSEQGKLSKELTPKIDKAAIKRLELTIKEDNRKLAKLQKVPKKDVDRIAQARAKIQRDQERLAELRNPKLDLEAIRKSQDAISENEAILARTSQAHTALTKTLSAEKKELLTLAGQYETVSNKLKKANQTLADAKQARDDAFGQFSQQYGSLPDIVTTDAEGHAIDQLATYEEALANQAKAVAAYHKTLDQLRKLGLDDKTYQKLVEEGTADQQFADQLLAGGKTAVQSLNKLDRQLSTSADALAKSASRSLYQAGVNAAQGIVDGLKSKQSELRQAMKIIADSMVFAMKKSLGIKSPSTEFAKLGRFAAEGMSKGLIEASKSITDAVYMISDDAMGAMKDSLSSLSDSITKEIDPNPTITPVIDLTNIQNGSKKIANILGKSPLVARTSLRGAAAISSAQTAASLEDQPAGLAAGTQITYEQNNYSPKALSSGDIYRATRTQIATFRRAVNSRQFERPG